MLLELERERKSIKTHIEWKFMYIERHTIIIKNIIKSINGNCGRRKFNYFTSLTNFLFFLLIISGCKLKSQGGDY